MATIQTIATTLTADARPAITSLRTFDAEVGKAFSRLDAMNKRAFSSGGAGGGLADFGRQSSNASRGILELSRGLEDFSTQFGTQGFAGGIRAASNNLSQMAMVMGGPVAGAIAGFAAAGATLAMPYIESLFDASVATKKLKEETDAAIKSINDLFERRVAGNVRGVEFGFDLRGVDKSDEARSEIERRRREARVLDEREFFNRQQRDEVAARGGNGAFSKEIEEELTRLDNERLSIQEKQLQTQHEIARLREKEKQLLKEESQIQKQKDADEFANRVRKFQEEDAQADERDRRRVEAMLQSRIRALGGGDPLEGMNIPDELKDRIRGALETGDGGFRGFAASAERGTAAAQRLIAEAKSRAREEAELKKQTAKLTELVTLIRDFARNLPDPPDDTVNLN